MKLRANYYQQCSDGFWRRVKARSRALLPLIKSAASSCVYSRS